MTQKYTLDELDTLELAISIPCLVFLKGDLGSGKTTLSQSIIKKFGITSDITSPTYTYYNRYYSETQKITIYHFDLYRISDYEEFIHIGGEEILDNNDGIILIEWPEIIEHNYISNIEISIKHTDIDNEREINITKKGA